MNRRRKPSRSKRFERSTGFRIEFNPVAERQMLSLDPVVRGRLDGFLSARVADNPRRVGRALEGRLKGFWRYKIGDYRILCRIEDERSTVVVVAVGHRVQIYEAFEPE